ncbi:MAG: rod shape-determining protein MreD, partial [Pseudomonadota bacterium]
VQIELAPLGARAGATPAPDLLFCVVACLVLRRPEESPAILILLIGLARDLVGGGPVGLGALLLFAGAEALRLAGERARRLSLLREFVTVALAVLALSAAEALVFALTLAPTPPLEIVGLGALVTCAAYPAVVALLQGVFRIRRAAEDPRLALLRARR